MLKCPICSLEIDHIKCVTTEYTHYVVRLPADDNEKIHLGYDPDTGLMWVQDTSTSPVEDKYICPLCHKEIAQDEEGVVKFLKGG